MINILTVYQIVCSYFINKVCNVVYVKGSTTRHIQLVSKRIVYKQVLLAILLRWTSLIIVLFHFHCSHIQNCRLPVTNYYGKKLELEEYPLTCWNLSVNVKLEKLPSIINYHKTLFLYCLWAVTFIIFERIGLKFDRPLWMVRRLTFSKFVRGWRMWKG